MALTYVEDKVEDCNSRPEVVLQVSVLTIGYFIIGSFHIVYP